MKKRVVSLILLAASALTVTALRRAAGPAASAWRTRSSACTWWQIPIQAPIRPIKLAVRDAVLREAGRVLDGAEDPKQAVAAQLPALESAANAELQRQGSEDLARVSFRRELFPTREYDTFSLPAGVY